MTKATSSVDPLSHEAKGERSLASKKGTNVVVTCVNDFACSTLSPHFFFLCN